MAEFPIGKTSAKMSFAHLLIFRYSQSYMLPIFPHHQSLVTLASDLRLGKLHLSVYLDELEAYFNQREPDVLAFVPEDGRFDRLRHEAQALLDKYPRAENRPALFGVAIGVKDIFHVDGFTTRAGTNLPPDLFQGQQATSVTLLLQAGALILGKTVTTEFAYFGPGPTRNPFNPDYTPGGSSSGSAAAVGAGLSPLTLGSQTIGSINRPAAYCGAAGYKPSHNRIAKAGVLPLSPTLDHVGCFAPTVYDVELAASLLCRYWQMSVPARKPVLGIPEGPFLAKATAEGIAHFSMICDRLKAAGFVVKSVPAMANFDVISARHKLIVDAEMATIHADWFANYADLYQPKTAEHILKGQHAIASEVGDAINGRSQLRQELTQLMNTHDLDLWISPSATGAPPKGLDNTGDPVMNLPWTHAGLPTLTIPAGFNDAKLPMGLQLTGRWYTDETLLSWGAEIEPFLQ